MKRYTWLYKFAWTFEICAALAGVVMAAVFNFPAYDRAGLDGELTATEISGLLAGTVPFLMIAFAELTKIPFATAFLEVRNIVWKLVFGIGTLCLSAITFETISSGLESSYHIRTAEATGISLTILSKEKNMVDLKAAIATADGVNVSEVNDEFDKAIANIRNATKSRVDGINKEQSSINTQLDKRAAAAVATAKVQIDEIRASQGKSGDENSKKVASMEARIAKAEANVTLAKKDLDDCLLFCDDKPLKIALAKAEAVVEKLQAKLDSLQSTSLTGEGNSEVKAIQAKLAKVLNVIGADRKKADDRTSAEIADANKTLKRNVGRTEKDKDAKTSKANDAANKSGALTEELETLQASIVTDKEAKSRLAQDDIVHRMAEHIFGKADTEEETKANISMTAKIWFGGIGLIVAITGPLLAFAYIVLNRENVKEKSKFRALARAIMLRKRKKEVIIEEKVVEVEKIVIEKEIIHVPIFTNDPDMIELSNAFQLESDSEGVK